MINVAMIGECPICGQGALVIARDNKTGTFYVACDDCEAEWKDPVESRDINKATRDHFGQSTFLSLEEALTHPWKSFIK